MVILSHVQAGVERSLDCTEGNPQSYDLLQFWTMGTYDSWQMKSVQQVRLKHFENQKVRLLDKCRSRFF